MTKAEIISNIAEKTGMEKKDIGVVVEGFMNEIKDALANKENVYLRGFGTYAVKHRAQKTARNR